MLVTWTNTCNFEQLVYSLLSVSGYIPTRLSFSESTTISDKVSQEFSVFLDLDKIFEKSRKKIKLNDSCYQNLSNDFICSAPWLRGDDRRKLSNSLEDIFWYITIFAIKKLVCIVLVVVLHIF